MKKLYEGPLAGMGEGLEPRHQDEKRKRAIVRMAAGKFPPLGPITRRLASRRRASIALAAGPLRQWANSGPKNTTG